MTRRGLWVAIAAVILFVMADFTQTGWVQLADSLLWSILIVSLVIPWASASRVRVRYAAAPHSYRRQAGFTEGDNITYEVEVTNPWPWPIFGLVVQGEVRINGEKAPPIRHYLPFVGPLRSVRITGVKPLERRGLHEIPALTIESSAPFGLCRRRRTIDLGFSIIVYPSSHPLGSSADQRPTAGSVVLPLPQRWGEEISGSRPYAPGDLARDIHWRNYARTGKLMSRAFVATTAHTVVITLGTAPSLSAPAFEDLIRLAAGAAERWTAGGQHIRIQQGPVGLDLSRQEALQRLALLRRDDIGPLSHSLGAVTTDATVVAVLDASDITSSATLAHAAGRLPGIQALLLDTDGVLSNEASRNLTRAGVVVNIFPHPLKARTDPPQPQPELQEVAA